MNQEPTKELTSNRTSDLTQRAGELLQEAAKLLYEAGMMDASKLVGKQAAFILDEARRQQYADAIAEADCQLSRRLKAREEARAAEKAAWPAPQIARGGVGVSAAASPPGVAIYSHDEPEKKSIASGDEFKDASAVPKLVIVS
jgi:hypothetical protein